jgi:hypothetical protein
MSNHDDDTKTETSSIVNGNDGDDPENQETEENRRTIPGSNKLLESVKSMG